MKVLATVADAPGALSISGHMTILPYSGSMLFLQGASDEVLDDKLKPLLTGGVRAAIADWQTSAVTNHPNMHVNDALRLRVQVVARQALAAKMKRELGKRGEAKASS